MRIGLQKRGLLSFFLLVILVAGLAVAGCGDSGGKTVKIGMVYELTGNTASYGTSAANGAKLAFKAINASGGVLGKQIQLITADNKGEPSESANAMTKVVTQDKVATVIGFTTSSNALAATGIAQSNKVPLVSAAATNPKVTLDEKTGKVKDYVFRVCFIDPFQGTVGANFALNTLKSKNAAIMIDNSSDYSKGLAQFFKESYTKNGGTLVSEEAYLQKDQDFKTILTKIKATNPDLIYVPGYYEEVGILTDIPRNSSGKRIYLEKHINRLKTICCFKNTGMSIAQLQEFFQYEQQEPSHIDDILKLLTNQKNHILAQLAKMQHDYKHIQKKLAYYQAMKTAVDNHTALPNWQDYKCDN